MNGKEFLNEEITAGKEQVFAAKNSVITGGGKVIAAIKNMPKKKLAMFAGIGVGVIVVIITTIILVVILSNPERKISTEWGKAYYRRLVEMKKNEEEAAKEESKVQIIDDAKGAGYDSYLSFIEVDGAEAPVMIIDYGTWNDDLHDSEIYYVNGNSTKKVEKKVGAVGMFYSVSKKKFNYYADWDGYALVSDLIQARYKYDMEGEYIRAKGLEMGIKFKLVEMSEAEIAETVERGVESYKPRQELLTSDVKTYVKKQLKKLGLDETEEKTEETEKTEEKKEASETKTNTTEEKKDDTPGYKVGKYKLEYGKYQSSLAEGAMLGGAYTLKDDGTFTFENSYQDVKGEKVTVRLKGEYKVMEDSNMLEFTTTEVLEGNENAYLGRSEYWEVTKNNEFHATQYDNSWSLVKN